MDKQEFDLIVADIAKVMAKHNCELIITSEISFKKLDGNKPNKTIPKERQETR